MLISVCFGIALSACCGFRVFVPLLGASIAIYKGWLNVSPEMEWLGGLPSIIAFGTAVLLEISAYYIPFLDNILDFIAIPLAVIAGTVLSFSLLPLTEQEPLFRWIIAAIAGGATAGTIQAATGLIRIFSTKATVGSGNALIATAENIAAILGTILSFIIPVIIAVILVLLVIWVLLRSILRMVRHEEKVF